MKEFYQVANKVLMIKRNHPVVTKVKRETESGETEIFEEKKLAEGPLGSTLRTSTRDLTSWPSTV
jgi:hypothetical protein